MPLATVGIVLWGLARSVKVFECFIAGAGRALKSAVSLLPALLALVTAVSMMRQSGALDALCSVLAPIARLTGIPQEVLPLALISPISGSGSLTVFEQIISQYGVDSLSGRIAAVIMCSSETTFYAVTVYYGSIGVSKTRCTVPAALLADITCFVCSAWAVRLM